MAPELVKVAEAPLQIAVGELTAVTVGVVVTFTETVFVLTQPETLVPDNVYVVVTIGATLTVDPVRAPGFQV